MIDNATRPSYTAPYCDITTREDEIFIVSSVTSWIRSISIKIPEIVRCNMKLAIVCIIDQLPRARLSRIILLIVLQYPEAGQESLDTPLF